MIKSLTDIFNDSSVIKCEEGLKISQPGLFSVKGNVTAETLELYADLASRIGVEAAGMRMPVTDKKTEDAFLIHRDEFAEAGKCIIELEDGGILIRGADYETLKSGVEYIVTAYPYTAEGKTIAETVGACAVTTGIEVDVETGWPCRIITGQGEIAAQVQCGDADFGSRLSYDRAKKHFVQNLQVHFVCDDHAAEAAEAVLSLALRLALENYETVFPYAGPEKVSGRRNIVFTGADNEPELKLDGESILLEGTGLALETCIHSFCKEEENLLSMKLFKDLENIFSVKNEIGQALEMLTAYADRPGGKKLITREYAGGMVDRKALEKYLSDKGEAVQVLNFNDSEDILGRSFRCVWEGTELKRAVAEKVLPSVKSGGKVKITARLSEDIDVRRTLEAEIRTMIEAEGAEAEVSIFCAYKSGYSWIEERAIPEILASGKDAASVKIGFPYLLNERGDDQFEDESTPNYGMHMDNPLKFFDIPTRWLQELFPADELLARELGVSREQVEFYRDDSQKETYVLTCTDAENNIIWKDSFDVKYVQKNYIEKYPQIGRTHVTTGWVTAQIDGETVLDERIESDPEKVWRILETEILPLLETYLVNKYGVDQLVNAQPLFNRLQIDVLMSEMDRDLGFRQERISIPEAMQEDIYFYLLDWFKTYGERECGHELDNVGLIMPEPEIRKGKDTQITVTLYDDLAEGAEVRCEDGNYPLKPQDVNIQIERISCDAEKITVYAKVPEPVIEKAALLNEMTAQKILIFYQEKDIEIHFCHGNKESILLIPARKPEPSVLSEADKNELIQHNVVDYEQYLELLKYYENRFDLRLIPVETTYKGRKIFAIDCMKRISGVCYAENKMKSERVSTIFTARHHGNESSSLNSTFLLLEKMMGELDSYREKMNVIMVPFINIDGGMLHCHVQRKHPKWLCHPARYNSAGFEFRKDFDNPNSKYGEARMLQKLWDRYLFDVITDNHGFEGHELCQPFSGYISPWYKSFWVPRALYYGYIWYKSDYRFMVKIAEALRAKVAEYINRDEEIRNLNIDFADRFYKYAQKWFPDLFTLQKFNDVVFYWIDTNVSPRAANFGMRNPEITAIDWTTEVADETAVGEYMGTNVRAHHISDLATLDLMKDCELCWDCASAVHKGQRVYSRYRRHPLFSEVNESF